MFGYPPSPYQPKYVESPTTVSLDVVFPRHGATYSPPSKNGIFPIVVSVTNPVPALALRPLILWSLLGPSGESVSGEEETVLDAGGMNNLSFVPREDYKGFYQPAELDEREMEYYREKEKVMYLAQATRMLSASSIASIANIGGNKKREKKIPFTLEFQLPYLDCSAGPQLVWNGTSFVQWGWGESYATKRVDFYIQVATSTTQGSGGEISKPDLSTVVTDTASSNSNNNKADDTNRKCRDVGAAANDQQNLATIHIQEEIYITEEHRTGVDYHVCVNLTAPATPAAGTPKEEEEDDEEGVESCNWKPELSREKAESIMEQLFANAGGDGDAASDDGSKAEEDGKKKDKESSGCNRNPVLLTGWGLLGLLAVVVVV